MSLMRSNLKMAIASVHGTRWRSVLTMLGIVVGIVSVVTAVGIGEGVKRQIAQQVDHFGKDLITVRPGTVEPSKKGFPKSDGIFGTNSVSGLSDADVKAAKQTPGVAQAAPMGVISGAVATSERRIENSLVIATNPDLAAVLGQKITEGEFLLSETMEQNIAVVGTSVGQALFKDRAPLGHSFTFRGQTFIVRGVFDDFNKAPFSPTARFNDAIFIPYTVAQRLTGNTAQLHTILAKPTHPKEAKKVAGALDQSILKAHAGQHDFTVLDRDQTIAASSDVLSLMTTMIAAVAVLSLLVGGVGIMNIMLVSVTERMHEIGIRKAIGATNRQILMQFLLESVVLSVSGGVIGIAISLLLDAFLHIYTSLKPVVSWQTILLAFGVSVGIGILFGTIPAVKAARKDPIDALRHE